MPTQSFFCLNDYVRNHDAWYVLVLDKINEDPSRRAKPNAKEVIRANVKKVFIRLL